MAGILKVDQVQSDSNLAFNIAGSNVAFMNATSLQMVGSNVSLAGTNVITNGRLVGSGMPIGSVLQVVQTVKSDTFSASPAQGTYVDVTGLSVSITPTSATSKILCFIDIAVGHSTQTTGACNVRLVRGSTPIYIGDAAGSRAQSIMSFPYIVDPTYSLFRYSGVYLDSPATTSSTTYKYQISGQNASYTVYVNRTGFDNNRWEDPRVASSITVMEIAA